METSIDKSETKGNIIPVLLSEIKAQIHEGPEVPNSLLASVVPLKSWL